MKTTFKTILILVLPLLLANCGDDEETDYLAALVGTWNSGSIVSTGCTNSDDNGTLTCSPFCFSLSINANGSYTLQDATDPEFSITETGTVTVTKNTIDLCEADQTDCEGEPGTYILNGNNLTVTFTDDDSPGCLITTVFTKQ